MVDLFQARFLAISECSQETFFLGPVFIEGEFLDCKPLTLEKKAAMQRVLFEYLFLCDQFQKSICSISEKESSTMYFFPMFLKVLLKLFQSTLMKRSITEFSSVLGY